MPGRLAPRGRTRTSPPDPATDDQKQLGRPSRPKLRRVRDLIAAAGDDPADFDKLIDELDEPDRCRGCPRHGRPHATGPGGTARPAAAKTPRTCPSARSAARTVGKTYTAPDSKPFRPSLFVTLTCPSLWAGGRRTGHPPTLLPTTMTGPPRDALAFAALFDRFIQNLRRYVGYDLQYFAAVEPQKRLAPHVHIAMRGTISPAEIRRVLAATYHQVWWPDTSTVHTTVTTCRSGTSHRQLPRPGHRGSPDQLGPGPRRARHDQPSM